MKTLFVISLLLGITVAIVVNGDGRGRGGRGSFSSSSSEEHRHRPNPPRRPNPARRRRCDPGWLMFERPNGIWCILVGNSGVVNGWMSQPDAEVVCKRYGATLTGFQNSRERQLVANEALKQLTPLNQKIAGLWIGATNNPGCRVASCGPLATFRWTDGHTTGTDGFDWGRDEPDGNNWP
uniref:C-type lectin domain-containing protein n=1 Tax=Caenorhabditis tropicalis TaxID=1561998 RepID=A0A1I7UDV6_9PELO